MRGFTSAESSILFFSFLCGYMEAASGMLLECDGDKIRFNAIVGRKKDLPKHVKSMLFISHALLLASPLFSETFKRVVKGNGW